MKWDHIRNLPVEGSYKSKDPVLERLLLSGWHRQNGLGHRADGILPYVLSSGLPLDKAMADHYRDIVSGKIRFRASRPDMENILCRLYFCDSEEDIWEIVKEGHGDIDSFVFTYAGYGDADGEPIMTASPGRLERFCDYLDSPAVRQKADFIRDTISAFGPESFYISSIDTI